MKARLFLSSFFTILLSFSAYSSNELVSKATTENTQQNQHNLQREATFKLTEKELKSLQLDLLSKRDRLQSQNEELATVFAVNEKKLLQLEEQLRLETGSLGEVFGVVRQNAKELKVVMSDSVTSVDSQSYKPLIDNIAKATELPSMEELQGLWKALEEQITATGQLTKNTIRFVDGNGKAQQVTAFRLGAIGLIGENGYLAWNNARNEAKAYVKQPKNRPTNSTLSQIKNGDITNIIVDPSRGVMLEQLALTPTLMERFRSGGIVGKIILCLMIVGLGIAFVRGVGLIRTKQTIRKQLKTPNILGNNPLGRILSVYEQQKNRSVEALELRLLEAIVDELTSIEKGLSMLKLLAALAPMLGLLGTVTGMIETFQVITQFGNGDPKVMAGGISMALITTVLGLSAAMPLLLAHNLLSSQVEHIRIILEKQSIGLVAERAEKELTENLT